MKNVLLFLVAAAAAARADLVITEVNSNGTPMDFWELTNFGGATVDLSGFKWDDDSANPADPAAVTVPGGITIAPNESVLFVTGSAATFRSAWNLDASVKIVEGGPGLGQNDAVHLFNAMQSPVTSLNYAAGGFTRSNGQAALGGHAGNSAGGASNQSVILDPNFGTGTSRRYTFASGANFLTYSANAPNDGVGSPGLVGQGGMNSLPVFTNAPQTYWRANLALGNSPFRVTAVDTDPGQTVTLSVLDKPAWMTLTSAGAGSYRLGGTPPNPATPQVVDYTFTVRATDSAVPAGVSEQTVTLTVFPTTSPILLNEYNAVASDTFLRGGTASADEDGVSPGPVDTFFGRIAGNGGQWVEFAVVGTGVAGSTTDMRGWTIEIIGNAGTRTVKLSQDPYWSNVISGTILTFTAANTATGGLDTMIHRTSALHNSGFVHTNVWMGDPNLVDQAQSTVATDMGIDSDDTRFAVRNAAGIRIYGPAGEGVATSDHTLAGGLLGVSSRETLRLQQNPNPGIDPLTGTYNDADNGSTFGAPNSWGSGPTVQSFSAYVRANSPPRFTSTPETRVRGSYNYAITTADPNGHAVTVSATELPAFLTLTPGSSGTATLTTNRPLTLADAGEHTVRLIASDGQNVAPTTPQVFTVTVFNESPTVILNEYNAVAPSNFLNGGDASADSDGPPASADTHFGRVAGNGGRWFELAVVGNGEPSIVDMRGWSIDIGTSQPGGAFATTNTLRLSEDSYWSALPAGTILTFIDRNTTDGGLNSEINRRDRLATHGDAWTNVWMGDPALLTYTSAEVNGFTVSGGTASGIRINNNDTQFVVKNAAGERVFGPVGEGVAPLSGVSGTEVFELEAHPSPAISPLDVSSDTVDGYDDGGSGSTFGSPNRWHQGDGGNEIEQDFSPFIPSADPFGTWAAAAGLTGADAERSADPDGDGRTNFHEYAFGGNPAIADAQPTQNVVRDGGTLTWSWTRRSNDPGLTFTIQRSSDLETWVTAGAEEVTFAELAHPELAGHVLVTATINPSTGPAFFRAVAE